MFFLPHAGAYPSLTQGVSVVRTFLKTRGWDPLTRTLGHNIALLAVWKRTRTSENVGRRQKTFHIEAWGKVVFFGCSFGLLYP